jgi:hypothetical protein
MEKSYEDGVRDGELKALIGRVSSLEVFVNNGFQSHWNEINALKKAVWMLYGAIGIVGFIVPLIWRWALGG